MADADTLEKRYSNIPVRLAGDKKVGHGILSLAGGDTSVTISSHDVIEERDPATGWFNLGLKSSGGESILLMNALTTRETLRHGDREEQEYNIFPNIVVFNSGGMSGSDVRQISFELEGFSEVFAYPVAEWLWLHESPPSIVKSLRSLRGPRRSARGYGHFNPHEAILIHQLPRVLRERVGARVYEVSVDRRHSWSRGSVKIEPIARATIKFDTEVSLNDAIDAAWSWRRFFQQLAMRPLALFAVRCQAGRARNRPWSEVYLSNARRSERSDETDLFRFTERDVPYGEWKDRKKFSVAMRSWLEQDERRLLFRVRLDRVLEQMEQASSAKLIADLCSAIETLEELRTPSNLKDSDLVRIVEAAAGEAAKASPPIPAERIEGLLALLHHQSLPQKLKALCNALAGTVHKGMARRVIKHTRDFRTFEAHGGNWDEMRVPLVFPTLHMLSAMCVLWDLTTSGFPISDGGRRLGAFARLQLAEAEMMNAENEA